MASTFGSIETAVRALRTNQLSLQVTGQNLANADTPGYSRQVAVVRATAPYSYPGLTRSMTAGQIGTGVEVSAILRMRDSFIDAQIQGESSLKGEWEKRQQTLEFLEVVFNEPSDSSLSTRMNQFWDSLQELANRSDDSSVRSAVRENAVVFIESIQQIYKQLVDLQQDLDYQLSVMVGQVNTIATQIANLNDIIGKVEGSGQAPNDLLDQREQLVQELAEMVNINVTTDQNGRYNILVGGSILVAGNYVSTLTTKSNMENQGLQEVVWQGNGTKTVITSGKLGGLLAMRDEDVQHYIDSINAFASTLIKEFNAIHQSGFGLGNTMNKRFFSGTDASDIGIDPEIMASLNNIAASVNVSTDPLYPSGAPGNGENALKLAQVISQSKLMNGGTATLSQFYNELIAKLGVDAEKANTTYENQEALISYLEERQENVAGVSLDEELSNMIKFSNAYNAASRYLTAIDELLDRLIQGTGVVGR